MMVTQLLLSLLPTSLVLLASAKAAPVQLNVLNPDNFKSTISKGVWCIEFFSPYCYHCQGFAPTWTQLVENTEKLRDPGIRLAQVNCATNGDLCMDNNVTGYPQMNIYRNEEFVETYKGPRDYDLVNSFLSKHAEPTSSSSAHIPSVTEPALHLQTPRTEPNPDGTVLVLNDKNFKKVVDQGPVFVKFFAPWCGHCQKLAPHWTSLASHMKSKLNIAEVNCDDQSSICQAEDIQGYPMLFYYANGVKTEYNGGRKLEPMRTFAEKASEPPVRELVDADLDTHVAKEKVVYVLVHEAGDSRIVNLVTQASHVLLGSPPIYTSSSPALFSRFSIPDDSEWALVALKDHDSTTPAAIYYSPSASSADLSTWLLHNRLPTSTELDQETFKMVMSAPHHPLVVITATPNDAEAQVKEKLRTIGLRWRVKNGIGSVDRDVVFTWMNKDKWGDWLKSMYGIRAKDGDEGIAVVVTDHKKLIYWDSDKTGGKIKLSATSIFSAIEGIKEGNIRAKHSENVLERMVRSASDILTGIEYYIVTYPARTVFFLAVAFVMVIIVLRRIIKNDVNDLQGPLRKGDRLD